MKKMKQFIAVFMTAVFLAGTYPLTLSAADTRGDASMISVQSNAETAEDTGKQAKTETIEDAGKQAEPETGEDAGDAGKQAETEAAEAAEAAGKQAEPETAEDTGNQAEPETAAGRKYSAWSNLEYITPSPSKLTVKKETSSSGTRKAKISWNIIYGCNGYNVFVTTNPNGTWYWNQSTDISAKSTGAVISRYRGSKLKKGTTYYVRIVTRRKRNGVFCTVPMPAKNTYVGTFRF